MGVGDSRRCLDNGGCYAMVDMIEETERRRVELRQGPGRIVTGGRGALRRPGAASLGARAYRGGRFRAPWGRDLKCEP